MGLCNVELILCASYIIKFTRFYECAHNLYRKNHQVYRKKKKNTHKKPATSPHTLPHITHDISLRTTNQVPSGSSKTLHKIPAPQDQHYPTKPRASNITSPKTALARATKFSEALQLYSSPMLQTINLARARAR